MNINLIFTLFLFLYMAGVAVIGLFMAKKRSWIMTSVRVGVTVIAAILAIFVSALLANLITDLVYDRVVPLLGDAVSGFMDEVSVGAEGLRVIVALLVAPLLYAAVFGLIRLLLMIAVWIVEKCIPALQDFVRPAISMPVGALNGLLIAVVTLIPLCGYMTLGAHMLGTFVDSDMCDTAFVQENVLDALDMNEEEVSALSDRLEDNVAVILVHKTVGRPVFNALTTAKLDTSDTHGEVVKMNLETELCGLVKTAGYAVEVMDSFEKEDYTAADKELLYATADSFFGSEWVRMLATDTLVAMSDSWLKGEEFAGMAPPSLDPALQPTLNCVLSILSTETVDTLEEDIHDILDVVGDLLVHDLLNSDGDYMALVQKLGTSGLLTDMLAKLQENERLSTLATELKSLSVRLVTNMLGTEQLKDGRYADMMGNVAGTLTDALDMSKEDRDALVVESVQDQFANEGYDVPPEVIVEMTDQIMADLGSDGEITSDELTDYLVDHSDEMANALPDGAPDEIPAA